MNTVLLATMKRNYHIMRRAFPWSFIFGRFVGGAYTAIFSYFIYNYAFSRTTSSEFKLYVGSSDYMTYSILGASFYVFAVAILMNIGRSLMNEVREGTLETLLISPASRKEYFIGILFEQIWKSSLEMCTILLIGWILGARYNYSHIDQILLVWLVSLFSLFSVGVCLSAIMLYLRDTYITQNTLFISISFLCGICFPIQYLPFELRIFSHTLPITAALSLFRHVVMNGQSIINNLNLLLEIFILSVIYLCVGFLWISRNEKSYVERAFS